MNKKDIMLQQTIQTKSVRIVLQNNCNAIEAVSIACEDTHEPIPLDIRGKAEKQVKSFTEEGVENEDN